MEKANIVELNGANYENVTNTPDKLIIVDFWASWCMPCRAVAPVLDRLADENPDRLIVGKVNVDENRELAQTYGIASIPSIFFYKGGKIVDKMVGSLPYQDFKNTVDRHIGGA